MNIDALFEEYRNRLKRRQKELATGNIEDYLVRQFFVAVSEHSDGELFAATICHTKGDAGTAGRRHVDICVLDGSLRTSKRDLRIALMLEAKYFSNSRLLGLGRSAGERYDKGASKYLDDLQKQALRLQDYANGTLDEIQVRPHAVPERCALVLAGYEQAAASDGRNDQFDTRDRDVVFSRLEEALKEKFTMNEANELCPVYETSTAVLGMQYSVELRAGLFKPRR